MKLCKFTAVISILTNFNDEYDFGSIKTYYLPDSINYIVEEGEEVDHSLDSYIVSELERNFEDLGWERLLPEDSLEPAPDVMVLPTVIKVTNYQVWGGYPWYPGWGWGWGWYYKSSTETNYWGYPGYGWGYPYYPTYVTYYEVGTVLWDLVDPENIDEEGEVIYVEWTGAINGVVGSSVSSTKSRITNGIEQAFIQSPYLSGE